MIRVNVQHPKQQSVVSTTHTHTCAHARTHTHTRTHAHTHTHNQTKERKPRHGKRSGKRQQGGGANLNASMQKPSIGKRNRGEARNCAYSMHCFVAKRGG